MTGILFFFLKEIGGQFTQVQCVCYVSSTLDTEGIRMKVG